jgi:hypothetical protein
MDISKVSTTTEVISIHILKWTHPRVNSLQSSVAFNYRLSKISIYLFEWASRLNWQYSAQAINDKISRLLDWGSVFWISENKLFPAFEHKVIILFPRNWMIQLCGKISELSQMHMCNQNWVLSGKHGSMV